MKYLPIRGEKLNIVLICVVPLMVPILRSNEHISNFVSGPVFENVPIDFSNTL